MRVNRLLAAAAALFIAVLPARGDQQLGPGRITGSDAANGDIVFGNLKIGRMLSGKRVLQPDAMQIQGPGSTGPVDAMSVTPGANAISRALSAKLGERTSLNDYIKPFDLGDYAPALERAAADGVKVIHATKDQQSYSFKRTANLPNADIKIVCDGVKQVSLNLLGANNTLLNVGNSSTESYNFYLEGCLFNKEQVSSQGALVKLTNVYKWGVNSVRVYGDHKVWRFLELNSASSGISRDVDIDNILERAVYINGGTTGFGLPGGAVIDNDFDLWYVSGCVQNPADATQDGAFYFDDNFQAQWILNIKVTGCQGYAVFMKGTAPNIGTNKLNFVFNPNADAAPLPDRVSLPHKAGTAYFGYVAASQISGPASWTAGWGMPAINFSQYSSTNTVRGFQIPVNRTGGQGVLDDGTQNIVQQIEAAGYDADADAGLVIGPHATKGVYKDIIARQLKRAVVDQSADSSGYVLDGLQYNSISGQPLTGMAGNTNEGTIKTIRNITNLDAGSISLPAASTINLPDRGDTFFINSTGTINAIAPTYIGRRVTLILTTAGITLGDTAVDPGVGGFYLAPGGNLTTDNGRWRITLEWRGDWWFNISTVH